MLLYTYIRFGLSCGVVHFHLILATHDVVRVQEKDNLHNNGDSPIPANALYTEPQTLFADPLHAPDKALKLMTTGVDYDTLSPVDWLDLS